MKNSRVMSRILGIALAFVLIGAMLPLGAFSISSQVAASPGTIYVPDDHGTIQAAVNAASPGNTIIVRSGIYTENVVVDRQLTLIGEGQPVIDANGSGSPITLEADLCTLEGFAVQNSGSVDWDLVTAPAGIKVVSNGNRLINNVVAFNNWYGIHLHNSRDNLLMGNTACNNLYHGIRLSISDNNTLRNNVATNNKGATANVNGIQLGRSNNNTLDGNTADSNDYSGIELWPDCNHNTLINNTCNSNERGPGIYLDDSSHNILTSNLINSNSRGIHVSSGSTNNVLTKNVVESNVGAGMYFDLVSPNNVVYLNNLLGNDPNLLTHSASSNAWNSLELLTYGYAGETHTSYLGNYWSDYTGSDTHGDGIGDTPYVIASDADNYPLIEPFHNYLTGPGGIGDWSMTTILPQGRRYHTSVEHNGNIYVIGGWPVGVTDIWYSRVHDDGSLGTWQSTMPLPQYRAGHTSMVHNGHVYVVGGRTRDLSHGNVWYSRINADGALGSWMSTTALPEPRCFHASVVHNNHLYVLGGGRKFSIGHQVAYSDVWYAEIKSDGSLGSWVSTTALPVASWAYTAVVYNSHLYMIDSSDVWFAKLNSDGSLGNWTPANPLPEWGAAKTSVLHDGHVYVIGGGPVWDFDRVWYAPIYSNGTVGTWNQGTSLIKGRASHSSVVFNGYAYAIGGFNQWASVYYNDVEYAPFLGTAQAVGRTVLIESLSLTHGPYTVGQTLTATFKVQNTGDAAVTLDKLLLGGRYNGGELPGGGFPDFSHQTVTLQPGQTHEYEGTFTIPAPGDYYFFIAYYIENPTEAEKQFLDEHNWNTCIDLGPGLTDADRTRHIVVSYEKRVLVEIYGTGSTLALRDEPEGEVLMRLPDGWVLWVEDTHGNSVEQGGHIWWELEDEILNVSGWAAKEFLRIGDQHDLVAKARLLDDLDERRVAFLDAVANYYFGSDGRSCLYAGIDPARNTNLNLLREKGVPIEVIMAIAGQEGAFQYSFDNTIYDQYYATIREDYRTAGVGIMQIHGRIFPDGNKGWGSNLLNYRAYEAGAYPVNGQYHHDYYGNTPQGIHANVKDGFRVMQYGIQMRPQSEDTMENVAKVITAYNTGETYPSRVASRLKQLGEYYGDDYGEQLRGLATEHGYIYAPLTEDEIDDLYGFLTNYERVEANSPVEVMVLDSKGRITGLVDGDVVSDIPYSVQVDMTVVIFNPVDRYSYVIKGTDSGDYDLRIVSFKNGAATAFTAISIPTMGGAIHQYTVDWEALAQGEDGVAVQVDADGDGVFEESFATGSELTVDEFILKTATIVTIDPETLNLQAPGEWITAYIELPEGYAAENIDISAVRLLYNGDELYADWGDLQNGVLMVKFDWAPVAGWFAGLHDEAVELTVAGKVDGIEFEGTATIRVIDPPRHGRGRTQAYYAYAIPR